MNHLPVSAGPSRLWLLALTLLVSLFAADACAQSATLLPTGYAGRSYSTMLSGSGGTAPYTFALERPGPYALPQGLTLSSDGRISGTITSIPFYGSSIFSVLITDANGTAYSASYRIDVPLAPVSVSPSVLPAAKQGEPYSQMLVASGGLAPYSFVSLGGGTCSGTPSGSVGCANFVTTGLPQHLPPGLRMEANGLITGTPTAPGNYSILVAVLDNGWAGPIGSGYWGEISYAGIGLKGWHRVELRIEPHVLTLSPEALPKGRVGAPYDVQFSTSNGVAPYTYLGLDLPKGLSLSETGRLTGTPTATSDATIFITSTESGQRRAQVGKYIRLTIEQGATAPSLSVNAMAGVPVRVMLTDGAAGGPFTAANVVSLSPSNAGTTSIAQTGSGADARFELTYTPDAYFSGVATLRYTLNAGAATSSPATITFNVVARPDPTQDAEVRGLLNAQADSARRFANSQIGNFQQRLTRTHGSGDSGGFSSSLGLAISQDCAQIDSPIAGPTCDRPRSAPDAAGIAGSSERVDGHGAPAAEGAGAFGLWTAGTIRRGDRDGRNGAAGTDFESDGVSLGADYRYGEAFVFGGGLGYGRDDSDIGVHGSRSRARALTLALYASYAPGETYFLDGLLGYQHLSFDLRRYVSANGNFVHGSRDGGQWFGSISAGADLKRGDLQFTPYVRVDVARASLDAYSERGDPIYALAQDALDVETTTGSLGLRLDFERKTDWGVFTPQLRLEYQHDFQGNGMATMRYADLLTGPYYTTRLGDFDRSRFVLGLGTSFAYRGGWSFRVGYDSVFGGGGDSDRSLQLGIERRY